MQTTLAQFNETQSQDAFALQNSKLLKVRLVENDFITVNGPNLLAFDGPPVLLNVAAAPTFADAQAAITWSSGVQTGIRTDFKMKNLMGKSSGETVQMSFSGQGWVLVQPSEGQVAGGPQGQQSSSALGSLLNQ